MLHDIGNPPFGHFGEKAIQDWFRLNGTELFITAINEEHRLQTKTGVWGDNEIKLSELKDKRHNSKAFKWIDHFFRNLLPDFLEFDGNPQGFRIVTRLQWNLYRYSLNLTYSQLASILKYNRCCVELPENKDALNHPFCKKAGYFFSEKKIVDEIRSVLHLDEFRRFPLTYIMEAADDIAYCLSDIEDGMEKNLITPEGFAEHIRLVLSEKLKEWQEEREAAGDLSLEPASQMVAVDAGKYLEEFLAKSFTEKNREQDPEGFCILRSQ
ncbi:MAG: hypothetical protein IPJ30_12565 [Acidobacteria bacterium]|nr:hypothetical protein [Acidobacteriota bacterium]